MTEGSQPLTWALNQTRCTKSQTKNHARNGHRAQCGSFDKSKFSENFNSCARSPGVRDDAKPLGDARDAHGDDESAQRRPKKFPQQAEQGQQQTKQP
jgi:hypothetical protein